MIENSVRQKEKLRRMREEAKWLQSLVGEDWGIRVLPAGADKPRPVHANRNERFEAVIVQGKRAAGRRARHVRRSGDVPGSVQGGSPRRRIWLDRLCQKLILRHFDGVPREFRIKGEPSSSRRPSTSPAGGRRRARPA